MTALLLLLLPPLSAPQTPSAPRLEHVRVLTTAAPGAEIVAVQASTRRAVLIHSGTGQIEVLSLADPAAPVSGLVFDLAMEKGEGLTSVAVPPKGDWCLAVVVAGPSLAPGRAVLHSLTDGKRLATFPCGVGPDSVAISSDGTQALIANEAEGFDSAANELRSAPGSLTHIRFAADLARSTVTQIAFVDPAPGPTDGRVLERSVGDEDRELPLESGADWIEPEVVAFVPGGLRALVTLQENNCVALVDLAGDRIERVLSLGNATHPADLVDDKHFDDKDTLLARREPDGIAVTPDGRYFVTADEGDTGPGVEKTLPGTPIGGGRTLSVFDVATGALVGDTGPGLDRLAAKAGIYSDKRSPKKGSEPEMVVAFERDGGNYAAVTLERAGGLALVDLRDPKNPVVLGVERSGSDPGKDEPEGLAHFRDPAGGPDYFYVANEGTGTLGVLRVPR